MTGYIGSIIINGVPVDLRTTDIVVSNGIITISPVYIAKTDLPPLPEPEKPKIPPYVALLDSTRGRNGRKGKKRNKFNRR